MCCRAIILSLLCSFFLACVCVSLLPRDQQHVSILRFNNFLSSKLHVQVWHVAGEYCGAELLNDFQAAGNDLEQLQQNLIAINHLSTLDLLAPSLPSDSKHASGRTGSLLSFCAAHAATDVSRQTRSSLSVLTTRPQMLPSEHRQQGPARPSVGHPSPAKEGPARQLPFDYIL